MGFLTGTGAASDGGGGARNCRSWSIRPVASVTEEVIAQKEKTVKNRKNLVKKKEVN